MSSLPPFRTLSFDCYGTLIDWETGIATAMRPWAESVGLAVSDAELVAFHGRHETHVQQDHPEMAYPSVLGEVLRRVGSELGASVSDADASAYGDSVGEWPAFDDAMESLARLKERYRLVILSNVDRASFVRSNEHLGVDFDLVVTAEDVGSYKPELGNFEFMFDRLAQIDSSRDELLHVAESLYHDHEPAQQLGLPSVWIHRRHNKPGLGATAQPTGAVEPQWRFTSMESFADAALTD